MNPQELKAEFGDEAELNRLWLSHLECYGTTISATLMPELTETETLKKAWHLVQSLAVWLIERHAILPANERFSVIVGWSRHARLAQGQIFKTGGTASDLQLIAKSSGHEDPSLSAYPSLRQKWQKDVFVTSDNGAA